MVTVFDLQNCKFGAVSINKSMNYDDFLNSDGTYTSPKNGKVYKTKKALIAHLHYAGTTDPLAFFRRLRKVECRHCKKTYLNSNIERHEMSCYLNPGKLKFCSVCEKPIKNYKSSKGTCSYSCSNVYFSHLRNKDERLGYKALCFRYHKKECAVCKENKIVAVHHYDENHKNDLPENLIPLCPTHHQYVHSRYRDEVQPIIDQYLENWKLKNSGSSSAVE